MRYTHAEVECVKEEMHLQENTIIGLDLRVKVTGKIVQYPLHYVTYALLKFEAITSNG